MKKAILVASFGTTHEDTEQKNIVAVERAVSERFPEYHIARAYTSSMILRVLSDRGTPVDNLEAALNKLSENGFSQVVVLPTHVIPGDEYEKVYSAVNEMKNRFNSIKIARPLLDAMSDIVRVGKAVAANNPIKPNECLVLFGHGSEHYANTVYSAMEHMLKENVCERIMVGTVEGYPSLVDVKKQILAKGYKSAVLVPLMLVAGDHAKNDMASSEPDSWVSQIRSVGVNAKAVIKGLGEYTEVQQLYCEHLNAVID